MRRLRPLALVTAACLVLMPGAARAQIGGPCEPGSYGEHGIEPCTLCAPGTYTDEVGADQCDPCPAGTFASEPGATACTECPCDDGLVCTVDGCGATDGSCSAAHDSTCRAVFRPLGQLPDGVWSVANDVSADGAVVVGWSMVDGDTVAYRWTAAQGMVGLGDLPGGDDFSEAHAVSADGSVVVGASDGAGTMLFGNQAFEWTEARGMEPVPPGNPTGDSSALGVSDDGSAIVGWHYFTPNTFTGYRALEAMTELPGFTVARDASADGAFVVGYDATQAKRWSAQATDSLGTLAGDNRSRAEAVTPDGETVVGRSYLDDGASDSSEPFRWTPSGGMVGLGHRSDRINVANDVSHGGSLIVGTIESGGTTAHRAFVWTQFDGLRTVHDMLLEDYGLTLPDWTLSSANGVSADGSVIVGNGSGPNGEEAWMLTLPEPDGALGALAAAAALGCLARSRWRP